MDSNNSLKAVTVSGVDWTVRGTVVGNSGQPIAGVMVEAWDKDLGDDDHLGRGTTNEQGQFEIKFGKHRFHDMGFEKKPDLYFLILRAGSVIAHTKDAVMKNVDESTPPIVLTVPE